MCTGTAVRLDSLARDSGMRCPSVVNNQLFKSRRRSLSSAKSRYRYLNVSANTKLSRRSSFCKVRTSCKMKMATGIVQSCMDAGLTFMVAYPQGTLAYF